MSEQADQRTTSGEANRLADESTHGLTGNKLLERRLSCLMRLHNDIPSYVGDAPKAQHYQAMRDAITAAIQALRAQPDRPADVVERARDLTCAILGYKDWGAATDYRTTGREDQERDRVMKLVLAALNPAASDRAEKMREALEQGARSGERKGRR